MNIVDALKSGKNFKRKKSTSWLKNTFEPFGEPNALTKWTLSEVDILADDWEIEKTKVTITREDFDQAVNAAISHNEYYGTGEVFDLIATELGL